MGPILPCVLGSLDDGMIYKVLDDEEVHRLNKTLQARLPGTAKIFYVIQNFLCGLLPGKEVIVDTWPEWSSIIVRSYSEENVQKFFRNSYMCHANSASALKYFLQRPGVIDWRKPATFTGVPRDVAPLLAEMCRKHLGTLSSLEPRFMYAWTKKEMPTEPVLPKGLSLGSLTSDDAITLRRDWEGVRYREDLEGYFNSVIENFDSSCLMDENGDYLAYICMQYNGSMAMLYVKPEHKDKDYFRIVLTDLARKRLSKEEIAYGFIPTNDTRLVRVLREMDFTWVPAGDMVWVHYEPLKINRSVSGAAAQNEHKCQCSTSELLDGAQKFIPCTVCLRNQSYVHQFGNPMVINAIPLAMDDSKCGV